VAGYQNGEPPILSDSIAEALECIRRRQGKLKTPHLAKKARYGALIHLRFSRD